MSHFIDIHCHLSFPDFDQDVADTIKRAKEADVQMITIGTTREQCTKTMEILNQYPELYGIVGLHPIHSVPGVDDGEVFDSSFFKPLLEHKQVVGIGECGLDFFRLPKDTEKQQREAFIAQIELAKETKKPLMLHIRDAYKESLEILEGYKGEVTGDTHFFAGSIEDARRFLDLGFYISFTGVITFASMYKELVEYVPLDRIMTETDSPFVAPIPHRGNRCEPAFVVEVAQKIAAIKKIPVEELKDQVYRNAQTLFGI